MIRENVIFLFIYKSFSTLSFSKWSKLYGHKKGQFQMIEAFEYFFNSEKLATFLTTLKICWMNCWMQYLKTNLIMLFLYDSLVEHSNCQSIVVFDRCFLFYILPPCSKPAVNQESNVRDLKKNPPSAPTHPHTHTQTHTHTHTHTHAQIHTDSN